MRQRYFAGFQLASLHTFPLTLALCFATAVLQLSLTYWQVPDSIGFLDVINTGLDSIFRGGLLLVCAVSLIPLRSKANYSYFLRRLRLPSSHMGFLWSTNILCALALFWGSQIVTLWGCNILSQTILPPDTWSHQTFFIDCYRSPFLHSVLPMGDWIVWVRNSLSLVAIALASGFSLVTAWQRGQAKLAIFTITMVGLSCVSSGSPIDVILICLYIAIILVSTIGILQAEEDRQ